MHEWIFGAVVLLVVHEASGQQALQMTNPIGGDPRKAVFKVTYFGIRGRAEPIRQLLAYAGVPFYDNRINQSDWAALKPSIVYVLSLAEDFTFDIVELPFGQMPVLEVNGNMLSQSQAITRYLGRLFGMAGSNDWEAAQIDQLNEGYKDIVNLGDGYFAASDAEKPNVWNKTILPALQTFLPRYQNFLDQAGNTFFVGNRLSYFDINLAASMSEWKQAWPNPGWQNYPRLTTDFVNRVQSLPSIKRWIDYRPKTDA